MRRQCGRFFVFRSVPCGGHADCRPRRIPTVHLCNVSLPFVSIRCDWPRHRDMEPQPRTVSRADSIAHPGGMGPRRRRDTLAMMPNRPSGRSRGYHKAMSEAPSQPTEAQPKPPLPVLIGSHHLSDTDPRGRKRAEVAVTISWAGFIFSMLALVIPLKFAPPRVAITFLWLVPLVQTVSLGLGIASWRHARGRLAVATSLVFLIFCLLVGGLLAAATFHLRLPVMSSPLGKGITNP